MPAISLQFSAAGTAGWTPSVDVEINGFSVAANTNTSAALSYDEAVTWAAIGAPSVSANDRNLIAFATSNSASSNFPAFPCSAGQSVFVAAKAALTATIYFNLTS